MSWNMPPGCSPSDIPGNRPDDSAWDAFFDLLDKDTAQHGMTDVDAWLVWSLGLAVYLKARESGAKFPHDEEGVL